ncbi:hypothetical protein LOK49_LG11G00220 [Camellia lanceoleosa]|uniref:Uncharacterized protein n=1 Tax=Camellia lanceoleosa TaxID=1840588 RepID=A0ACC0FX98_9ERIC|nr:hypothetical protein LOK49_LG11G00220 [Camellia lanceoleosa]
MFESCLRSFSPQLRRCPNCHGISDKGLYNSTYSLIVS